ncbi:OmpA family protein [bacterium]|nr:OmpA family protein [bacterium]
MKKLLLVLVVTMLFASCGINKDVHKKTVNDLKKSQLLYKKEHIKTKKLIAACKSLQKDIKVLKADMMKLLNEKMNLKKEKEVLNQKFLDTLELLDTLKAELTSKGSNLEALEAKQKELSAERQKMQAEKQHLLEQLARLKKAAELRNQEFQKIMGSLQKMIDAGTLTVTIRKGRMIVSLSSDILFPSGRTTLTDDGKAAIAELSATLSTLDNRAFLVVGHSDSSPIRTKRYPSNWELSSQRAIEVVRLMVENEVKPEMLTAGGAAEFDPLVDNDTLENKAQNRRVEIIFLPKIDELPGFDSIKKEAAKKESPQQTQPAPAVVPQEKKAKKPVVTPQKK